MSIYGAKGKLQPLHHRNTCFTHKVGEGDVQTEVTYTIPTGRRIIYIGGD